MLLSTALPGCAHLPGLRADPVVVEKPVPQPIVVRDTPPAALARCADRPDGLPEDDGLIAQIPTPVRGALIRIARALRDNADRLDRLVNWASPGTCPANNGGRK